jgi:hypothetical protein
MAKAFMVLVLMFCCFVPSFTQTPESIDQVDSIQVDQDELRTVPTDAIEFINYSGPIVRFETADQIRSIGSTLGNQLTLGPDGQLIPGTSDFGGRYRITRIPPDPSSSLRGADVLEFLPQAAVDHIDNVRRIITGYLEVAFGYSRADAQVLSLFITLYNGVHRRSITRFEQRFLPEVLRVLDPERVGLSLIYSEWPGQSQIVIPLTPGARPGDLLAVSPDEIASPEVIETLRETDDRGIEARQAVTDLTDRAVEQRQDQVTQTLQETQQQQQATQDSIQQVQEQRTQLQQELQEAEQRDDRVTAQEIRQELSQVDQQLAELQQDEQTHEQEQQNLIQQQAITQQIQDRSDEIREETARDIQDLAQQQETQLTVAPAAQPVLFGISTIENGLLVTRYSQIDARNTQQLQPFSSPPLVGRNQIQLPEGLLGITPNGSDKGALVIINQQNGEEIRRGNSNIFVQSQVVLDSVNNRIYAVVERDGDWYLGQFDLTLNPLQTTVIPVRPETTILLTQDVILLTRKDGRTSRISRNDLRATQN